MRVAPPEEIVRGQLSWKMASSAVEAYVTKRGGHVGPVTFRTGEGRVEPYAVAPWAEEPAAGDLSPMLHVLRGDFFCLPFGSGEPFDGEEHPPHGETANAEWRLEGADEDGDTHTLRVSLQTTVRSGRVDKYVSLVDGHTAVYTRHVVSGMAGPMSFGHHAMLRFPDRPGSGLVSTSPFLYGQTAPESLETPEGGGASLLRPGATFLDLDRVPTVTGETTSLSRYPARRGFEDLVLLVSDPSVPLAWTAVGFPDEGYVWFALKDPHVLRQTVFWLSNGGRRYAPWNSRHVNVMGLEDVTSYFHYGLKRSAEPNPLTEQGFETYAVLTPDEPLDVRYIQGIAPIPAEFGRVAAIEPSPQGASVTIRSETGQSALVPVCTRFLDRSYPVPGAQ